MTFDLNKHVHRLLMDEPFFAALSRRIDKRIDMSIPTAGVRVNPSSGHFEMLYNPEFFESLPDVQRKWYQTHTIFLSTLRSNRLVSIQRRGTSQRTWQSILTSQVSCLKMCCLPGQSRSRSILLDYLLRHTWNFSKKMRRTLTVGMRRFWRWSV